MSETNWSYLAAAVFVGNLAFAVQANARRELRRQWGHMLAGGALLAAWVLYHWVKP